MPAILLLSDEQSTLGPKETTRADRLEVETLLYRVPLKSWAAYLLYIFPVVCPSGNRLSILDFCGNLLSISKKLPFLLRMEVLLACAAPVQNSLRPHHHGLK